MLTYSALDSIKVTKFEGKKTFGIDQIYYNIFFQKELRKEEKFVVSFIRALYGDFQCIDDKKNNCSTTRIPYWRDFDIFFNTKYIEIVAKTLNHKKLVIQKMSNDCIYALFYDHECRYEMIEVNKDKKEDYEKLAKEFDKFVDHARLMEIPLNRCFPDPEKVTSDYQELRELVGKADDISKEEIVFTLDGILYHLEGTPLDDLLGRYIAGRRLSGFKHHQLKEALRNIFEKVNYLISRYFSDYGVNVQLKTSERLDAKEDDELFFNTPWYCISKDSKKVSFYDLTLEERNILYIVTAIITYGPVCAYFIIDEVYTHLLPAMKTNIEFLISEQAENVIHLLTTSSSHIYYNKKK